LSPDAAVTVVAVDLGATSGRVMIGRVGAGVLELAEVHRFGNEAVRLPSGLHWNVVGLFAEILTGLRAAGERLAPGEHVAGIGIDTWAVDYGLLDAHGDLLGVPFCYRDGRTAEGVERVHAVVAPDELYARNGLQFLPFNTVYQFAADRHVMQGSAATALLLPDLFGYWLTGVVGAEVTNASTTGLLDPRTRSWDLDLAERVGVPASLLPALRRPGDVVGALLPHVAEATGLPSSTPVLAVGSHDTASAVVAVPAVDGGAAYISSGTWSLVGVELPEPLLGADSRAANFTNEGGVDGRVRYLRNVMGLWLLTESLRAWRRTAPDDLPALLADAAALPGGGPVIDPDDPVFLPPGDMPARIEAACRASGQPPPQGEAAVVRCVLDSLAAAYARALDDAQRLSGRAVDTLHVVGGGARNALLCRLTAAETGRRVLAGPVEATALGNVLVQGRALGAVPGGLEELRDLVRRTQSLTEYLPSGTEGP
jgi:rhamnulokinase